ncbi:PREDICTED: auxin-induced in root cultures protein 12-like [Camelina sativa]|uniref:Auxin-induced in root cultures protein 12-like n=1 Tax=Camelina sativa TaxID=90675 RepID=A0ABM0W1H0_CAMSA|nr:PREDICTED: auxin-induced in root cultures protein 12-like [Camelina sativa]
MSMCSVLTSCLIILYSAMASPSSSLLILAVVFACFVSLISPVISQTSSCSTQKLNSAGASFDTCQDLPVLDSYLHYTYNASNSSLSVAFIAKPSQPIGGWVSWAINPTGTKMAGSQAFVAYRSKAGAAPVVKTYNISSYSSLEEGKLAFEFWNLRAESLSGGRIAIFTTVKVPAGADSVNQVWQIGGNYTNGRLGVHPSAPDNLNSHRVLSLTADGDAPSSAPSPATGSGSTTPGQAAGGPGNAGSLTTKVNFGVNLGIIVLLASIFIF